MEYEYSCKVKDLLPFIKYCINNNYELKDEYEQLFFKGKWKRNLQND